MNSWPALTLGLMLAFASPLRAAPYSESPELAEAVRAGLLPTVDQRVPVDPSVVPLDTDGLAQGQYGGQLRMLVSQPKDTRLMIVYGYARLVGYDPQWNLVPDLLARLDVEEGRIFTLHLRKGHRWSDGHPFTTEDFRFFGGHRQQRGAVAWRAGALPVGGWSTAPLRGDR